MEPKSYKSNSEVETFVSDYLVNNPDFFRRHPLVFTHMNLPRQNREGTRSVIECQNEVLRATLTTYEMREEELKAQEKQLQNQYILKKILAFSTNLLVRDNLADFPSVILDFYKGFFCVPHGVIRLWDVANSFSHLSFATPIGKEFESSIDSMRVPYWGENTGSQVAQWLSVDPEETSWTFLLPLKGPKYKTFGMLCLASGKPTVRTREDIKNFLDISSPITQGTLYKLTNRNC